MYTQQDIERLRVESIHAEALVRSAEAYAAYRAAANDPIPEAPPAPPKPGLFERFGGPFAALVLLILGAAWIA